MKVLHEAGLPDGVINFLPGEGADVGNPAMASPDLSGLHFTGSAATFHHLWKTIGNNIETYKTYPRIVGETGGKDFIMVHESADAKVIATDSCGVRIPRSEMFSSFSYVCAGYSLVRCSQAS